MSRRGLLLAVLLGAGCADDHTYLVVDVRSDAPLEADALDVHLTLGERRAQPLTVPLAAGSDLAKKGESFYLNLDGHMGAGSLTVVALRSAVEVARATKDVAVAGGETSRVELVLLAGSPPDLVLPPDLAGAPADLAGAPADRQPTDARGEAGADLAAPDLEKRDAPTADAAKGDGATPDLPPNCGTVAAPGEGCFVFAAPLAKAISPGTKAEPTTLIKAIDVAGMSGRKVAACVGDHGGGTLSLTTPVSIHGGYSCTTWTRPAGFPNGSPMTRLPAANVTISGSAFTAATVLDGIELVGSGKTPPAPTLNIRDGASPTVESCIIRGGATTTTVQGTPGSVALRIEQAAPEIRKTTIEGGSGKSAFVDTPGSVGVLVLGSLAPLIQDCNIDGGSGQNTSTVGSVVMGSIGVLWKGTGDASQQAGRALAGNTIIGGTGQAGPVTAGTVSLGSVALAISAMTNLDVVDSFLHGGSGTDGAGGRAHTAGVYVWTVTSSTQLSIRRSRIYGGDTNSAGGRTWGVWLMHQGGSVTLENDFIHSGNGGLLAPPAGMPSTVGCVAAGEAAKNLDLFASYNTMVLSRGQTQGVPAVFWFSSGGSRFYFNNNMLLLLHAGGAGSGHSPLSGYVAPNSFKEFRNNVLMTGELGTFDGTTILHNEVGTAQSTWQRTTGIAGLESYLSGKAPGTASGNLRAESFSSVFAWGGNGSGLAELTAGGWHLAATVSTKVTDGAIDLVGSQPTTDFYGKPRTKPYSIGAEER